MTGRQSGRRLWLGFAWRFLGREWRSGELRLLFAALTVAVAAVSAVGFFTERVHLALTDAGREILGGDALIAGDAPWPAAVSEAATARGLRVVRTLTLPSMVAAVPSANLAAETPAPVQMADVKAVDRDYPLRGTLEVDGKPVVGGPPPGTVWLEPRLAAALGVGPGQRVRVGERGLQVGGLLTREPDRGFGFFGFAPRLMMAMEDVPASGLTGFGARVRHRLAVAGNPAAARDWAAWLKPQLKAGERLEEVGEARPEMRQVLDRAERFLGLASLLTVILAAVACFQASRRYLARHLDGCAVMRCLGISRAGLLAAHGWLFLGLGLAAALAGGLAGYAVHGLLIAGAGSLLGIDLPPLPALPASLWRGAATVGVLLGGFVLPPLLQMSRVPTLRVLRRELGAPPVSAWLAYLLGAGGLAALIVLFAGETRFGVLAAGGFALALGLFWLVARVAVSLLGRSRRYLPAAARQGVANLARRGQAAAWQVVALALGLMPLVLLTYTTQGVLDAWRQALPAEAPNRFVINIQPFQRAGVTELLRAQGISAELSPMIRARLTHIGERAVSAADYPDDERARRLVEREFNLSWRAGPPPGNRQTAGRWFTADDAGQPLASVEEGLAKTLGVGVGDRLGFLIGGEKKVLTVIGLRRLEWDSMRVNFFVLTPPGVLEAAPASDITSFYLPPARAGQVTAALTAAYPNLTVIDVGAMLDQFGLMLDQLARLVRVVFLFTLAAGLLVLAAALFAAFDERRYEFSLLRALGASRAQLRRAFFVEMGLIGASAGLLAALGAFALGRVLAARMGDLSLAGEPLMVAAAVLSGALLALGSGLLTVNRLLRTPPALILRQEGS